MSSPSRMVSRPMSRRPLPALFALLSSAALAWPLAAAPAPPSPEAFLGFVESDPQLVEENLQVYLDREADPRLAEVMTRLESIYQAHRVEA